MKVSLSWRLHWVTSATPRQVSKIVRANFFDSKTLIFVVSSLMSNTLSDSIESSFLFRLFGFLPLFAASRRRGRFRKHSGSVNEENTRNTYFKGQYWDMRQWCPFHEGIRREAYKLLVLFLWRWTQVYVESILKQSLRDWWLLNSAI